MAEKSWADLFSIADTSGGDFSPLPKGTYRAVVDSVEVKQTKNGKKMFAVTYKVLEGEYKNRKLWDYMVVSEESPVALGIFFRKMAVLGADADFFAAGPDDTDICARIIDSVVKLKVDIDGEYNRVKDVLADTGDAPAGTSAPFGDKSTGGRPRSPFAS